MNELPRPLFFRRVTAWVLDTILWVALAWALVTFMSPLSQLNSQGLSKVMESSVSTLKKTSLGEAVTAFESLNLKPGEWEVLSKEIDRAYRDTVEPRFKDPSGFFNWKAEDLSGFQAALAKGLASNTKMSPDVLIKVKGAMDKTIKVLGSFNIMNLSRDLLIIFSGILLFPLWVLLGYFLFEGIFGASPGKFLLGLRVGTQDGHAGSILVNFPRYLGKFFGWILILISLYIDAPWLSLTGIVVVVFMQLTCLAILWGRRQPLYDRMTRTTVFASKSLLKY